MTEHPLTPPSPYTGEEMRALLVAGGEQVGRLNIRGAVHLLTFTDLPDWRGFHVLVDIERVLNRDHERTTVALVRDWTALPNVRAAQISGSGRRLLALAVSMAAGAPVSLREELSGFGHAHARRVMEAVAIATGADEFYAITPTPRLAELEAFHAQMQGGRR